MNPATTDLYKQTTSDMVLRDRMNRSLHDLRISVIDRCNFRCRYCMPEEEYAKNYTFLKDDDWLNFDEIERLTRIFVHLGASKVRLTGGEPLLRPDLDQLIKNLSAINGIEDLALTTNGFLLDQFSAKLKAAGLQRLTVSLDTLDPKVFKHITGTSRDVRDILKNIKVAEAEGFKHIKINAVVQRGVNDHTILDLVKYFKGTGHVLRFIEYMDVGNCNHWDMKNVVSSSEILKTISQHYPLKALKANYHGEVAARYEYLDGSGEVGFISSVTQPFCGSCTRARLSTDGKIFTCLFSNEGVDIKTALRQGVEDEDLLNFIKTVWSKRNDHYSEIRSQMIKTASARPKVEMFQIGG